MSSHSCLGIYTQCFCYDLPSLAWTQPVSPCFFLREGVWLECVIAPDSIPKLFCSVTP